MITEGKRKSTTLYLAAALLLASYFAQPTECFRLRKTERREGRKEADAVRTTDFQPGRVVFGNVFEKKPGPETQSEDGTKASNASPEDDANYQADSPGFPTLPDSPIPWPMGSVDCLHDKMMFRTQGSGQQLAMDPGAGLPVPLSHVSPICGYNVQRNAQSLLMVAPYSGCYMIQQGGYYILPMHFRGIPFSLWCPIHPLQPTTTAAPTTTSDKPALTHFPPAYFPFPPWGFPPGQHQQIPHFPKFPHYPVTAIPAKTSKQTTSATTTQSATSPPPHHVPYPWNFQMFPPALKPMPFQHPMFNPYYPHYNHHHPPKMDQMKLPGWQIPFPHYG